MSTWIYFSDDCLDYDCHHGNCFINNEGDTQCQCKEGWEGDDCNTPKEILNFYVKYYEVLKKEILHQ